jgi:hypothetical protein
LLMVRGLRICLGLSLESVTFEGVCVSKILSFRVNVEVVVGDDVCVVFPLLKFPCFCHLFTF